MPYADPAREREYHKTYANEWLADFMAKDR